MTSLNYIILAHKNPDQVKRLVKRLEYDNVYFYIHIDKSIDIKPFLEAMKGIKNINFLNGKDRIKCIWADFSIVQATINCINKVLSDNREGYTILLSGQDYPLHPNKDIYTHFEINNGIHYISGVPLPKSTWENGGMDRIRNYHFQLSDRRNDKIGIPSVWDINFYVHFKRYNNYLKKLIKKRIIPSQILIPRRYPFKKLFPYGGSQWWALPNSTLKLIIQFSFENKKIIRYFKHVHIPDEVFFSSIVHKLIPVEYIHASATYVNWDHPGISPKTFTIDDLELILKQKKEYLFCRKFDTSLDDEILNKIDEELSLFEINKKSSKTIRVIDPFSNNHLKIQ